MRNRLIAGAGLLVLLTGCAHTSATSQGQNVHNLYGIILVMAAVVFVLVEGLFIPSLLFSRNAIPTHPTHFTFTPTTIGTFPGQCTEFCGLWHSRMFLTLKVVAPTDFAAFVKNRTLKAIGGTCAPNGTSI